MKRKLLSVLLVLAMVLAILPVGAMAAEGEGETFESYGTLYQVIPGTNNVIVVGLTEPCKEEQLGFAGKILDRYTVVGIADGVYQGTECLTYVGLGNSIQFVGKNAFRGCPNLEFVVAGDENTGIVYGDYCFADCKKLESVGIAPTPEVPVGMFSGCSSLKGVYMDDGSYAIRENAFEDCSSLEYVIIPPSVDLIDTTGFDAGPDMVIHGNVGSTAERFAEKMGFTFKSTYYMQLFYDVEAGHYYSVPVVWAAYSGITTGYSDGTFRPEQACTRWQMVMFLWRLYGEPECDAVHDFVDVPKDAIYYDAVQWAYQEGITKGVSDDHFAPDRTVSRAMVVTMLWRLDGKPDASASDTEFTDIEKNDYYDAILWAEGTSVTTGYGDGSFRPNVPCTRGQIVTFIYRNMFYFYGGNENSSFVC